MVKRIYPHKPINDERWTYIQDCAKAAAREAIATGNTAELTALGRAYHEVFTNGRAGSSDVKVL
jgi:hypothetical protein